MKKINYSEFYKEISKVFGSTTFVAKKTDASTITVDNLLEDDPEDENLPNLVDKFLGKEITKESLDENSEISAAMIDEFLKAFRPAYGVQDDNFMTCMRTFFAKTSILYSTKIEGVYTYILWYETEL